jgi:hypothetical protein
MDYLDPLVIAVPPATLTIDAAKRRSQDSAPNTERPILEHE